MCNTSSHRTKLTSKQNLSTSSNHPYFILSPNAVTNLPKYQYNGVDNSLIYKYILSPLAGFLVDNFTPSRIAPNSITLFGLCLMLSSYLNIYYHCPTLDNCSVENDNVPGYVFLLNGIAMLTYQTLDNMDGKQARKTGSSSPLGLLFDHGCDAMNSIFGSVTWICAFGLNPQQGHLLQIWVMVFIPMLMFYVTTWEEYYVNKLVLPFINGPSEGLILGASVNFISWWFGRSFWYGTEFYDTMSMFLPEILVKNISMFGSFIGMSGPIQNYNMIVLATIFSAIRECISKLYNVTMIHGLKTIKDLVPMIALMSWSMFIVNNDNQIFVRNERNCFHLVALLFVEMVTKLMLDHTTGEKYNPLRRVMIPFILIHYLGDDGYFNYIETDNFIFYYTAFMFVYLAIAMKIVVSEICDLLGIWCFDIVSERKKHL